MLASAVNSALQSVSFPNSKPRLLLVGDSYDRLKSLEAGINHNEFDITIACSLDELITACDNCHDVVALDVCPEQIAPMLKQIRASASPMTVAGLVPEYRAMPCSRMEMPALVQRGVEPDADDPARRHIL